MGLTRAYANEFAGDPFRLRLPKAVRKFTFKKAGKLLGKAASIAAPFIPGVGGIAAQIVASRVPQEQPAAAPEIAQQEFEPEPPRRYRYARRYYEPPDDGMDYAPEEEPEMAFTRMYGYDYSGDPATKKLPPKRKSAGAGPKAKAQRKAAVRQNRNARKGGFDGKKFAAGAKKFGKAALGFGQAALPFALELVPGGGLVRGAARGAGAIANQMNQQGLPDFQMPKGGRMPRGFGGGHRRTMNPANVKALKHSLRRLEGFAKLVKRVEKMMPKGTRHAIHGHSAPAGRMRNHKAGCKCVGCR